MPAKQRPVRWLMALGLAGAAGSVGVGAGVKPATPAAAPPASAATFRNPVISSDFADPDIIRVGRTYYAYSTNVGGSDVPVYTSGDLTHWKALGDALPVLPPWASGGNTWAPGVLAVSGGYRLYFTARHTASGRQCIGVAASKTPQGPFVSASPTPLVCQLDEGGSIDAQGFTDADGKQYLYWKSDGNCCNLLTGLWVQPLSQDGLKLTGKPRDLLYNGALWEGNLIEAPTVYRHAGKYYLFYSAAAWDSDTYAVGYAVGASPLGPFKKAATNPLLFSGGEVAGPGGQGVIADGRGNTWMYYHAWTAGQIGYTTGGVRSLRLDPMSWKSGAPSVRVTTRSQPAPARP
ncbi:glycoside hydrolase family 43 protein [Deinococcus sp.]|uniref:glycoside hydrolase family 43 protein n=1 Tax=Deinococcus sp. TaxID=47478 RepID=UPI003C7BB006